MQMAGQELFYRERAAECRNQAENTDLSNVRQRCLSAAIAWDNMAVRMERTQKLRASEAERKAEAGLRSS